MGISPNDVFRITSGVPTAAGLVSGADGGLSWDNGQQINPLFRSPGNRVALLGNSIMAQNGIKNPGAGSGGYDIWASSIAKTLTNTIAPQGIDLSSGYWPHLYYTCVQAGTTGTLEPSWPLAVGQRVADGTVVWECTAIRTDQIAWDYGWWHIAQALSGQRLNEVYISGRSGKKAREVLSYIDTAMAKNIDTMVLAAVWENDCWPGAFPVLATVQSDWYWAKAEMDRVRGLGIKLMVSTVLPSGFFDTTGVGGTLYTGYSNGTATRCYQWLNRKIKEYAKDRADVILIDYADLYTDPDPANPVWPERVITYTAANGSTGVKTDGIHPYGAMRMALGQFIAPILSANFPAVNQFSNALDQNGPALNPKHFGTAGTKGVATITPTGTGPSNGYTATAFGANASASVLSKVARTDKITGEWVQQTIVFTGAASQTDGPTLNNTAVLTLAGSGLVVGDIVQSFAELKILGTPAPALLQFPQLRTRFNGGSAPFDFINSAVLNSSDQNMGQMITADTLFTLKTVPVQVPAGCTAITNYWKAPAGGANATYTVQYGQVANNKIVVPDLA